MNPESSNSLIMKRELIKMLYLKGQYNSSRRAQSLLVPSQSSTSSSTPSSSSSVILPPEMKHTYYCHICMEQKQNHEMFNKMDCEHSYCMNCISSYISVGLQDHGMLHFKCPEPTCKDGVLAPEICREILPKRIYSKWLDALCEAAFPESLKLYCPFKNCSALLVWDDDDDDVDEGERGVYNVCPHCNREFCVNCRVAWHSKFTCEEYKKFCEENEDVAFVKMADNRGWKRCPNCSFYVQKSFGCSYIRCRCQCSFCYSCGSKFGGRGNGCSGCVKITRNLPPNEILTIPAATILTPGEQEQEQEQEQFFYPLHAIPHHPAAAAVAMRPMFIPKPRYHPNPNPNPIDRRTFENGSYKFWGGVGTSAASSRHGQPPKSWNLP